MGSTLVPAHRWWVRLAATAAAGAVSDNLDCLDGVVQTRPYLSYVVSGEADDSPLWKWATPPSPTWGYALRSPHLPAHVIDTLAGWAVNAQHTDLGADVARRLAAHPATPVNALNELVAVVPKDVFTNPNMADQFADTMGAGSLTDFGASLLRCRTTQLDTTRAVEAVIGVSRNVAAAGQLLDDIVAAAQHLHIDDPVRQTLCSAISANPNTTARTLRTLAAGNYRDGVAANPSTPADTLRHMYTNLFDGNPPTVWPHLLINPNLPGDIIETAVETAKTSTVHLDVLANPSVTTDMRAWALCGPIEAQLTVSTNHTISVEELDTIADNTISGHQAWIRQRRRSVDNTWATWAGGHIDDLEADIVGFLSPWTAGTDSVPGNLPELTANTVATVLRLAPDWKSTVGELVDVARALHTN